MKKLKNFVSNTSQHQQEQAEIKNKRNASHQKSDSINYKINMMIQSKYYNSPSSLISSLQHSKANTRVHSAYRRSNTSSHSNAKHNSVSSKPLKDMSKIHNLKAESTIKGSKGMGGMKSSKSENKHCSKAIRKLKTKGPSLQQYSKNDNSHYIIGNASISGMPK